MSTSQSTHQTINHLGDSQRPLAAPDAGHVRSYWSWLLFKEAKQLAPLLIALCAAGFVLHLLCKFGYEHEQAAMHKISLMMIPLLFAIGAGPMLVSQEKEQRTLGWIGSLPVGPRSIVLSKLIVCAVGLALSWLVSIGLTWLLAPPFFTSGSISLPDLLYWICGTFAVLSLGFALAWKFSTAISSLIALAIYCCVLTLAGKIALNMFVTSETYDQSIELLSLGLLSLVFAAAAVFYGQRAFITGAPTESIFSSKRWDSGRIERHPQKSRSSFWTLSPSSSLIWQISRQNSLLWSGLLLIVVVSGSLFLFFRLNGNPSEVDLLLSVLLPGGLALSWLGASVFGSDAYRDRINFLAQRGVAPGLIWWTRMVLPLGSVGLLALLMFSYGLRVLEIEGDFGVLMTLGVSAVPMIFAFTQWFSQWTRSTLLSFCVAPAAAAMIIGYQVFVTESLQAPWWILLPSVAVAILATRIMLCPWMDGRFDLRYWTGHGALLLVALGIPLIPFVYTWATYPDMSPEMQRSLAAEVEDYQRSERPIILDLKSNRMGLATDDATAKSGNILESVSAILDSMEQELKATDGPVAIPGNKIAIRTANLLSLRMDSIDAIAESEEPNDREQSYRQRYQGVILLLDDLVRHMRLSERLNEQDYADSIERWMVSELSRPGRRQIFTDQQYARIVASLADQDARNQARRRAIAMAWHESKTDSYHQFRNDAAIKQKVILAPRWLVARRDAAIAAEALLKQLESSVPRPIAYPGELDGIGLGSLPSRGQLWHRPWEAKAKQLAESLKSTPATKGNDDE